MTEYFWQCSFCSLSPYDRAPNNFNCLSTCLNCLPVLAFNILLLLRISTTYFQVVVIFPAKACLRLLNSKLNSGFVTLPVQVQLARGRWATSGWESLLYGISYL